MLVVNPMTADSRVEREAGTLGQAGYGVTVVATAAPGLAREESRVGYTVLRLPYRRAIKDQVVGRWVTANFQVQEGRRALAILMQNAPRDAWAATTLLIAWHRLALRLRLAQAKLVWAFSGAFLRLVKSRILVPEYWRSMASRLPHLVDRPEVIHAHDLGTLAAAIRLAGIWDVGGSRPRVVFDSHELYVDQNPKWTRIQKLLWRIHEWRWIKKADLVITVSLGIADTLARRYRLRVRPTVLYNSPDEDPGPTTQDVRSDANIKDDWPLIVYVGAVKQGRGVENLLPALRIWRECHLALVGAGESSHVDLLREQATSLGVADRLHLIDTVPARTLTSYLRTADIGVHPMEDICLNHQLALPNKLFDYVFAGIPVAVSDLREMSRFVTTHRVGAVFDPNDARSVATTLRSVAENRTQYTPDRAARAHLFSVYGWPAQATKLIAAYGALIGRDPTSNDLGPGLVDNDATK
jgi:glycosyltransferase involved in cell wall biosynthesis